MLLGIYLLIVAAFIACVVYTSIPWWLLAINALGLFFIVTEKLA